MVPTIAILTPLPSPYQVELFDEVATTGAVQLRVVYLHPRHSDRHWSDCQPKHEHVVCTDADARGLATHWMADADLAVFAWYADSFSRTLIQERARSGKPWCFWGERPGRSGWTWLGRLRRRFQLNVLHRSRAPIWGMGRWAVERWKQEFGAGRAYRNIPYYSDLNRFKRDAARAKSGTRTLLYPGSLIPRKGVDLLAKAFAKVASIRPHIRLKIAGVGALENEMREYMATCAEQVSFLGFKDWGELPQVYHEADLLIAPSRYDGWGLIVPEGLAAGLPVIATDRMGAALELITPQQNGWRIAAGNLDALVEAMLDAIEMDDQRLREMSSAATKSVANHSLESGARQFIDAAYAALQITTLPSEAVA